mgnify:CR=1 FL=1|tara:strand:+ start:3967 stop:4695 length:729 start_codon:yes stop_codon:yes gene_type:complete
MCNNQYKRVAPKDIFSEANFLKNIAQMILLIEQGKITGVTYNRGFDPANLPFGSLEHSEEHILTEPLFTHTKTATPLELVRPRYSKEPWPIYATNDDYEEFYVFNDDGTLKDEFAHQYCDNRDIQDIEGESGLLFNVASFLKCLGKLALNSIPFVDVEYENLWFDEEGYSQENFGFVIENGYLKPIQKYIKAYDNYLDLIVPLDADSVWPLLVMHNDGRITPVFSHDGKYTEEFFELIGYTG